MRRKIVAGNWKMHGSRAENAALLDAVMGGLAADAAGCVVCPPYVYLHDAWRVLRGSPVALGAQDVCAEAQGAYTGEVSAAMLKDVGCEYVIVGHSERRSLYGEDDALVARKYAAALGKGLVPILCVGEQLTEREAGISTQVVGRQLAAVVNLCGVQALAGGVLAYEPVWAIGTGKVATPEIAEDAHKVLRGLAETAFGKAAADAVRILYGGSVKPDNVTGLMAQPDIDGALVGGASLKAEDFAGVVNF
jgi:triosephosphate isomerase